ncbi:MAG: WD40 repeat domain-containing protein [Spirochaetales bacterium]|nr:WD40 repeat domain-containing protein [Spirochaetales bacterium]
MKMIKILFSTAIFLVLFLIPVWGDNYVVQSGHFSLINDFKWLKSDQLFFSADSDGQVKIWDVLTSRLIKNLRVSHYSVEAIEVHPKKSILVVLVRLRKGFELKAIDWKTGKELYSRILNERPLDFKFSPRGSFLVLTQTDIQSLLVFDAEDGTELGYLKKAYGIVSYFSVSSSEKTIMVYSPSGKLSYIDFKTGKEKLEKPLLVPLNLAHLQISGNQLFLAATEGSKLMLLDLLTGALICDYELPNISDIKISEDDKEIAVISNSGRKDRVFFFKFDGKSLLLKDEKIEKIQISSLLYANRRVYFTDDMNRILYTDVFLKENVFSQNHLVAISDLAIGGDRIAVGNSEQIIIFPIALIGPSGTTVTAASDIKYEVFDNPLKVAVGLEFLRSNHLLIWSRDSLVHRFVDLNLQKGEIANDYDEFQSPLIQLEVLDSKILTLQKNGTCKILDSASLETDFQYNAPGMHKINFVSNTTLIGARSQLSQLGSPLLMINPQTGETFSISDNSLLCYDIAYDKFSRRLYSLSAQEKQGRTETVLRRHYGRNFESETIIYSYDGEDLNSSLTLDDAGRYLFTSIGYDILEWNGIKIIPYAHSEHIPRSLYLSKDVILSLNRDLSISVWNRKTRTKSIDLYFFEDHSWLAITADNRVYASEKGENYLFKTDY